MVIVQLRLGGYCEDMRYQFNLQVFYVRDMSSEQAFRPALLFTQKQESGGFLPKLSDIRIFDNTDAMLGWLIESSLLSYEQMLQVYNDLKSTRATQVELFIEPVLAAKQIPPINPGPGVVVPSEQFLVKLDKWKSSLGAK